MGNQHVFLSCSSESVWDKRLRPKGALDTTIIRYWFSFVLFLQLCRIHFKYAYWCLPPLHRANHCKSDWNIFPLLSHSLLAMSCFRFPHAETFWYLASFSSFFSGDEASLKKNNLFVSLHGERGSCNAPFGETELGAPQWWNRTWSWQGHFYSARLALTLLTCLFL